MRTVVNACGSVIARVSRAARVVLLGSVVAIVLAVSGVALRAGQTGTPANLVYRADAFADSVGVNLHLHWFNTIYADDFATIKQRLIDLGVRHVRDGLVETNWQPYYDHFNELGAAGIKGTFIVDATTSAEVLRSYPSRVADSIEAYEAPNEYNNSTDPNWPQTLRSILDRLTDLKNDPIVSRYPIVGPSLTVESAYGRLGDVSWLIDRGNLHNYPGGRNPGTAGWGANGYGSIDWNLALGRSISGGKPLITTETGYENNLAQADAVPQDVAARYLPRLLLEQFRKGISRTYIYELADYGGSDQWGLLNADGSPKPAYTAVRNLLALTADLGTPVAPESNYVGFIGPGSSARLMTFQKRGGRQMVTVWLEKPGYDVNLRQRIPVAPETWLLIVPPNIKVSRTYRWRSDGTVVTDPTVYGPGAYPITVGDCLTMFETVKRGSPFYTTTGGH